MATGGAIWTVNNRDAYLNATEETYGNILIGTRNYYEATGLPQSIVTGPSASANTASRRVADRTRNVRWRG